VSQNRTLAHALTRGVGRATRVVPSLITGQSGMEGSEIAAMVEPTYVHVAESRKGVTVAVTRCSKHAHIVRAWGVFRPDKVSNIQEIDRVEMQRTRTVHFDPVRT
jgi:hypothetical protein